MNKRKPIALAMALALSLVTALSATFAWFTSNDSATNHMATDQFTNGDVKIVEVFDPDDPINPGVDVIKAVGAVNTGSSDALVRVSFAEVLRKLENNGKPVTTGAIWNNAANTIPQLFSSSSVTGGAFDTSKGWKNVRTGTTAPIDISKLTIPSGVQVLYKETVIGAKTSYQFMAYGVIGTHTPATPYDGLLQNVTADFQLDKKTMEVSVPAGGWNFWQFTYPAQDKKGKWASLSSFVDLTPDYTLVSPLKTLTLPRTPSVTDNLIELMFSSSLKSALGQCSDGDWWYNQDDGYFYYIGKVGSGQATATNLLEKVGLNATATDAYNSLKFDLIVKMESIQNVEAALTSNVGWGMAANQPNTTALIQKLKSLNAFVVV
jgi:hypothetical protein